MILLNGECCGNRILWIWLEICGMRGRGGAGPSFKGLISWFHLHHFFDMRGGRKNWRVGGKKQLSSTIDPHCNILCIFLDLIELAFHKSQWKKNKQRKFQSPSLNPSRIKFLENENPCAINDRFHLITRFISQKNM